MAGLALATTAGDPPAKDRSPLALALSADGRWAIVANSGADTAALVDLVEGRVAVEVEVGRRPAGAAISRDATRAVVSNHRSGTVTVLELRPPWVKVAGTIEVGAEPRGVALSPDGARAFVAVSGEDRVVALDMSTLAIVASATVGREPWHVALTPDGGRLAVAAARAQEVRVLAAHDLSLLHATKLLGVNARHAAVSPDGAWAYVPNAVERGLPTTKENIDAGWILASRLNRVSLAKPGPREAIALDPRGKAVADVEAVALSPDGATIALAAGGTHELLLLGTPLPFVAFGGPADHIDKRLLADAARFRRVPLGGRPVSVAFCGAETVVVANYLANALQLVDVASAKVTATIPLGGPAEPSLARKGEALFHDGERSFHQWFSCHSCHTEGHTNGGLFDTFNDGKGGNPKKTLSLRGVAATPPWTWHGWQKELRASVEGSLLKTLQGPKPKAEELDALVAYLATLEPLPSRRPPSPAAARGAELFRARSCVDCHAPPLYTSPDVFEVGLESNEDAHRGFNPPSLVGVGSRGPWLHDGRAKTLAAALRAHDPLGGDELTAEQIADLVAFLESL